jgi:mono/diheme cytochrome c family protein
LTRRSVPWLFVLAPPALVLSSFGSEAAPPPAPPSPWAAPEKAKELQNPVKGDGRTVERGQRLYKQHCVPCHGETGTGDGPLARKNNYKVADLTVSRLAGQTDGEIFYKISKGKDPMPDFEKQLNGRERWDVVSYVRTLLKATP